MSPRPGRWRWILLALAVIAAIELRVLYTTPGPPLPPLLSAEEMSALPDAALISAVTTDLRIRLTAGGTDSGCWRAWPEPARHVLAWSWVEADDGPGAPPRFGGFLSLLDNRAKSLPGYEDIAAAYDALDLARPAAVLREADGIATRLAGAPEGTNPFTALDRGFRTALGSAGSAAPMRAYIRAHIAALAEAR